MAKRRNIVVVTGSRADFGLLTPVIRAIRARPELRLRLVVAGLHFVMGTWRDVEAAGFRIDAKVRMQAAGKSGREADVAAVARGIAGFGKVFTQIKPDVVLVLGDRIEAFAAASAASIGGVSVAHIHGGDRAEGVADEAMRHAISKLSHLHFAATALSRKRLLKMGELPGMVWNVGSPAVDGLDDVAQGFVDAFTIVMQHPAGASDADEARAMRGTLRAVRPLGKLLLVMAPNSDPGCAGVRAALRDQAVCEHLPRPVFLACLKSARLIVGNSSAGLIEAAALRVPCVNIGPRQNGREKPANVIDCDYGYDNVRRAIERALKLNLTHMRHPYGDGRAGERIARLLATVDLDAIPVRKRNAY